MPQLIRTVSEVMAERRADTLFLECPGLMFGHDPDADRARHEQLGWLDSHGIEHETVAPDGWLGGYAGPYLVNCLVDDPRIITYSAAYEDAEGRSLDPICIGC